jgi:hypothetical protein
MLEEMTWRIGLFQNHPEVLPRLVPFAKPPFYANSDDQTIFNDVVSGVDMGVVTWCRSRAVPCVRGAHTSPAYRAYLRRAPEAQGSLAPGGHL